MTKSKKRRQTVEEIAAELEADPTYVAMRGQQEALRQKLEEEARVAERPLTENLHAVGIRVETVWDLVNTRASYAKAIPVLLEHLERDYPPATREGIARALAVPEASWAWDALLTFFKNEPEGGPRNVKWALACALNGAATDEALDTMIELVLDKSLGENRLALVTTLARSKEARARDALEQLREDPQLSKEIRRFVGRPRKRH